ncbi:MAG TPA: adenylate/guanylate cyclase domain-containing protein, partial [Flavisolibacter sp.]|nr:adenylate/guanylate cyclase domain-containing protein [Flavisolibacter sp.]
WIEMQLSTQRLKHLLLIVAYRNNEVSESHPVKMMLDRLYKARIPLTIILLEPLNIHHLTHLIADTLLSDPENCAPLAEVIFKKTNGNPFFTRQCLLSLYESGALFFDPELKSWSYALQKVQEVQISDNVVELMVQLIEKLSGPEQNTLKLAACIGNQFSLQTLFRVSTQSADELSSHISALLRHGLLVPFYTWGEAGAEMYAFLHDRVQQAAMSLLGEEEKQEVRLQIGRLLLQQEERLEKGKNIYLIADHLNYAKSLITDKEERQKLAELNLAACQRARKATAYELGKRYIVQAMEILPEELWQQPLPFIAEVYLQRAECEHLCGNDTIAEEFYNLAISQPSDSLGKARLYQRKIHYYTNLRKFDEAYQTGREAVALLGVSLPQRFVPPLFVKDLIQFRLLLGSKKIPELINLPEMTNERMKMAILLMSTFARAAYQIRPELCVAVCTRMATICLRYGNTEGGFVGFMALGSIFLGAVLKQRQIGYDFGRLTLALVEKYKSLGFKAETYFVVGYFAIPWRDPAVEMERFWQIAYEAGLQSGDHFHASCACCGTIQSFYMRGVSFKETEVAINRYKDFLQRINNEEGLLTLQAVQQAIRNLSGQTASPLSFDDDAFDENRYVQKLATFASRHFAHYYFINKMQTLYLRGEYEKALAVSEQSDAYLKDSPGMMHTAEHFFYKGLILAARLQQTNESPFSKQARKLTTLARKLISYAAGCPDNFLHKSLLLQAEIKRYRNDTVSAERLYNEAIEMAVKYGYTNVQALANVRLGQLYLAIDRKKLAGFYLQEAVYAYITWGATAIAALLAKQYPGLVSSANKGTGNHFAIGANGQLAIQREGTDRLDLETVLKSSQAISSEIQLNNLLSTLMKIILENAGADRMVLLLEKDNALLVKAERRAGDDRSEMLDDIPLHTYESMARSVVNYVMRTNEPVILENASESNEFGNDDYFRQHHTKSVLCTALVQQGKLTGIIYLENNLTGAAFTRERIDLVLLLSGQMAISINNALLYENLEEKVKDRTRALKEEMDRSDNLLLNILPAETAEELKRTGSSKAKVFQRATVLFTDFKNFTLLSERLSAEELVGEINYCYSTFDQIISKYGIEKIKTIGDSYMCAGGLPVESETNPVDTLMAALEIRDFMLEELQKRKEKGQPFFEIRIGLHTGSVVAGIVGIKKFAYDIWGDTVNIASRMESSGEPGKVNISADTYELIKDKFTCSHRGKIQAKNKGSIDMYFVECPKEQEMPEPAETF